MLLFATPITSLRLSPNGQSSLLNHGRKGRSSRSWRAYATRSMTCWLMVVTQTKETRNTIHTRAEESISSRKPNRVPLLQCTGCGCDEDWSPHRNENNAGPAAWSGYCSALNSFNFRIDTSPTTAPLSSPPYTHWIFGNELETQRSFEQSSAASTISHGRGLPSSHRPPYDERKMAKK